MSDAITTVDNAIRGLGRLAILFVSSLAGLAVTTLLTTHIDLLRGDVRLPVPGLELPIPLLDFFRVAPWMVVGFHLLILLQAHIVVTRLRALPGEKKGELEASLIVNALLPFGVQRWVHLLLRLALVTVINLVPLTVLAILQLEFVPYHLPLFTFVYHQLPNLVDIILSLVFVPMILSPRRRDMWSVVCVTTISVASLLFSFVIAVVPGSRADLLPSLAETLGLVRDIDVSGQQVVSESAAQAFLDIHARGQSARTIDLSGRELRRACLSRAGLVGVALRGADLTGAQLVGTDLRGADLSISQTKSGARSDRPTILATADLRRADLRGARLVRADLRGADLTRADLRGAVLERADLRWATMDSARLVAADLRRADLRGAKLDYGRADCASFYAVDARGLSAFGLRAAAADLRLARLAGVRLVDARLEAAELSGAATIGADLRSAVLVRSRGLDLSILDLRHANLSGVWVAAQNAPHLTDFRGAIFDREVTHVPPEILRRVLASAAALRGFPSGFQRLEACRARLKATPPGIPRGMTTVQRALQARGPYNLVDGSASLNEERFHATLVDTLLGPSQSVSTTTSRGGACESPPLVISLVLSAWGCRPPRDPILEPRLRERILVLAGVPGRCPALDALGAAIAGLPPPDPPRLPPWQANIGLPRWPPPEANCSTWRTIVSRFAAMSD